MKFHTREQLEAQAAALRAQIAALPDTIRATHPENKRRAKLQSALNVIQARMAQNKQRRLAL